MSGGVLASAAGGTPKHGYDCTRCEDWGDIVEDTDGRPIKPVPCPACHPALCARCGDARTVTVEIGLSDAVVLDARSCPDCARPAAGAP